ncbi:hypothetical protein MLD38_017143 [Melastoma candidum]|uniref:Uncharacterized protein n=1 Tax=Melastoma candidum TaxID=119954 RepID=A0ACB9QQ85_9MYRT|nr:hypothetical protein MLD38_017143 [Melastoma candidum]
MALRCLRLLLAVAILLASSCFCKGEVSATWNHCYDTAVFNRSSFPVGFVFGTASAAYQYEGAAKEDGKGPSMWDYYTHNHPEKIVDRSTGDVALDQYHRYKEDIRILKDMNLDAYRLSISWPRILPTGHLRDGVNKKGVDHYNNLINELLANGIQPYVTLFHWDIPQALQEEYGGFLSERVVEDYKDFVNVCFKEFGDRVKHWITMNEPYIFAYMGYGSGSQAPGRCSAWQNLNCTGGDSAIEPYLVNHHLILAHATAVRLYKEKYQASQKGTIGVTLYTNWIIPYSKSPRDKAAALRVIDFVLGWFLHPITYGDYPRTMRALVGKRLPTFTEEQSKFVKGTYEFIGINYYSANYAAHSDRSNVPPSVVTDPHSNQTTERNGIPLGPVAASSWLYVYPRGLWNLMLYLKKYYNNPIIYITENGIDEANNTTLPLEKQLADENRISYYYGHLQYLKKAIDDGARVKGFFAWTFLDDMEWGSGYTVRFGLNYVDFQNGLKRYPKHSAIWFKNFLRKY